MFSRNDLKELQQRVYWSFHQDGLVDILFGIGVIGFGLMLLTGNVVFNILGWLPIVFYMPIKKAITIPRFGYIQFQSKRTLKWALVSLLVGIVILALVLVLITQIRNNSLPSNWQAILKTYDMLIIGGLLSIPLIFVSALTGLRRMLGYVGLILLVILSGIVLGIQPPIYMIALGAIILLVGSIYLGRFLMRYPIRQSDIQNGV